LPNIGPLEIAIVVAVALVIFGPKKIPELGRSAGKALREFKGGISGDEGPGDKKQVTAAEEVPAAATASAPPNSATGGAPAAPDDQA
jgi:sec-independent protein translocase protein TatA